MMLNHKLAVVVADTGAPPDDLLELRHAANHASQYDVFAGGRINAGGQQLRGGEDRGDVGVYVLEATEVPTPDVALVGCHPTDVVRILGDEVAVEVRQGRSHLARVLLIHAEDNGLGVPVT